MDSVTLTPFELFELELDTRLAWTWLEAWNVQEWDSELLGPFLRTAYWTGYSDAVTEHRRGLLYTRHGQRVPRRRGADGR